MRPELAALVGSRICHDLISPIGAIGNGIELLALTDGDSSAEVDLISESVENASARIRFFRVAYGSASIDQLIGRSEVLAILAACARGGRITYFWQVEGDQSRQEVRIAFLLLQCFETAMPMGGDVQVALDGDSWVLTGTSDRMKIDEMLWSGLTNERLNVSHTPAEVQFALMPRMLMQARKTLAIELGDGRITARF